VLVDSHCHLDRLDTEQCGDTEAVLQRARDKGVERFLCIATNLDGFEQVCEISRQHADVFCSAGVHPLQNKSFTVDYQRLLEQANSQKVIAVGETGLDYYYSPDNAQWQQESLRLHIQVAREVSKPLIIHTRDAQQDTLNILSEEKAEQVGGILHCFTESIEMATSAIDMGFYISFSGIITFHSADVLRDVARKLPLDRILVETDCPWLAPVPHRGKTNQPAYVRDVAIFLAELLGLSLEQLARLTTDDFYRLFPETLNDISR